MTTSSENPDATAHLYLQGDLRGGVFPFVVEPFSEDHTGRLAWGYLGNLLLRCASLHAGQCGFGYDDMQKTRHAWVLSRLVVDLKEMPRTGQEFTIETWVSSVYRQFTDRLFAITSPCGFVYGYAFSTWALIDVTTRQPLEFSQLPDGGFSRYVIERGVPIAGPSRIRLRGVESPVRTAQAYYSDLDINGHVNSIRYVEMMLDLFPLSVHDAAPVNRIDVAYSAESHSGDMLSFFMAPNPEGGAGKSDAEDTRLVEIRKGAAQPGTTVVRAALTFRQNITTNKNTNL